MSQREMWRADKRKPAHSNHTRPEPPTRRSCRCREPGPLPQPCRSPPKKDAPPEGEAFLFRKTVLSAPLPLFQEAFSSGDRFLLPSNGRFLVKLAPTRLRQRSCFFA